MTFFLGTHQTGWLRFSTVPLFISAIRLRQRKTLFEASCDWALDSGGFSELAKNGRWSVSPREYVDEVRRWRGMGRLQWAAAQDWMCEDPIRAKTGLSLAEHQRRTVENFVELRHLAPDLPFVPVLQGLVEDDYLRCLDRYDAAGFDLRVAPLVGVGSVCRRQATPEAVSIMKRLRAEGLRLHAFGFKIEGLKNAAHLIESADSLAWSFTARRTRPLPGCPHRTCVNCYRYALRWRAGLIEKVLRRYDAAGVSVTCAPKT